MKERGGGGERTMLLCTSLLILVAAMIMSVTNAFQQPTVISSRSLSLATTTSSRLFSSEASADNAWDSDDDDYQEMNEFIEKKYPSFHSLISKNDGFWKAIRDNAIQNNVAPDKGCTIFAPNEEAFQELGNKKREQLEDPRNLETAQKMGSYHVIATRAVTAERLRTEDWTVPSPVDGSPRPLTIGGVMTLAGEVPVGRSKSGGFLGWGAKEDGGIVIGPDAKIIQSFQIGVNVIHEVDSLVSPLLLWRYCDQLRLPGI